MRSLRLLAAFDNYLVGYRHRDEMLDPALRPLVYVGGIIKPTVLVNGRITGLWRLIRKPAKAEIAVTLFEPLNPKHKAALEQEATDLSRFLALPYFPHHRNGLTGVGTQPIGSVGRCLLRGSSLTAPKGVPPDRPPKRISGRRRRRPCRAVPSSAR